MYDDAGTISVDRGKIGFSGNNFNQNPSNSIAMPRNQWVKIKWILFLGIGTNAGYTSVYINDVNVISAWGTNVPDPAIFANYGVVLTKPAHYDAIEIGLSANSGPNNLDLYIDEFSVIKETSM